MNMQETAFSEWLNNQLSDRGWSQSEAARRSGMSASAIQQVANGITKPGPRLCSGLARAFGLSTEEVYRLAGLLPRRVPASAERRPVYRINSSTPAGRLLAAFEQLRSEDQELLVTVAERLAEVVEPRIIGDAEEA